MARTPISIEAQWGLGVLVILAVTALGAFIIEGPAPAAATTAGDDTCVPCKGFATGQPLTEPKRIVTRHGELSTTLTARMTATTIGGRKVKSQVYNGQFPGPTLVVDPGDEMRVLLRNRLRADYLPYGASSAVPPPQFPGQPYAGFPQPLGNPTNLHVHGMHVSPKAPSDDIFLEVPPGGQYQYRYDIPEHHPTGVYWYHPHVHEYTDMQVGAGQAGTIIVRGGLDDLPGIGNLKDRLMVVQNVQVKDGATTASQYQTPENRLITINGQVQPRIDIQPGESQRWRVANASTERFLSIVTTGGTSFWKLAVDGQTLEAPKPITRIWLAPGQRMEVLVQAGHKAGSFDLVQQKFNQRPTPYGKQPRVKIATVRIAGEPLVATPVPTRLLDAPDLRGSAVKIARKRVISFSQSPPKFMINGELFHEDNGHAAPVFSPKFGTVEQWKVVNNSPEWHNFHIHVIDYQIVERNGNPLTGQPEWADSVAIPPNSSVTLRLPFTDFDGRFVFHCHVLVHEDHGMMAVVNVVK